MKRKEKKRKEKKEKKRKEKKRKEKERKEKQTEQLDSKTKNYGQHLQQSQVIRCSCQKSKIQEREDNRYQHYKICRIFTFMQEKPEGGNQGI